MKEETINKSKSWWASALYFNLTASDVFGVTLRTEYFSDKKYGIKVSDFDGNGSNVFATTLSGNYKVGGVILIPELRLDSGSGQIFTKNKEGNPSKAAFSAILAAIYSF